MKKIKYSNNFERDFNWYLKWKEVFNFDGTMEYTDKNGKSIFIEDSNGLTAKECFYKYDSEGKSYPCREIELYKQLHKCKGSINFNIKAWAESRGKGELGEIEFSIAGKEKLNKEINEERLENEEELIIFKDYKTIEEEYELLDWMVKAVEKQKLQYY